MVLSAWPGGLIFLGHKKEPSPYVGGGWSNYPSGEGIPNVFLHTLPLRAGEIVQFAGR